jgi:hypothetical protein
VRAKRACEERERRKGRGREGEGLSAGPLGRFSYTFTFTLVWFINVLLFYDMAQRRPSGFDTAYVSCFSLSQSNSTLGLAHGEIHISVQFCI